MSAPAPIGAGEPILVVDDNATNLELAEAILEAEGWAVTCCTSGQEALRLLGERDFALVLLDVMMPGLDGYETCRRIKADEALRDVPVLFLTALSDLDSHAQALQSGGDDFLSKPIRRTELVIRVRSLLRISRLNAELRSQLQTIEAQRDALVEAQQLREEMTGFLVHDLNNPLGVVLGNADMLALETGLGAEARRWVEDIALAATSLQRMVMNLLDVARGDQGRLQLQRKAIELDRLLSDAVAAQMLRAQRHDLSLTLRSAPRTPVEADPELLRRVVVNLIDNAVKYTPRGGHILVEAREEGGAVTIEVCDDGPGIPEEFIATIFDRYVRVPERDSGRTRVSRGMGLAFCRLVAEAHGGRIEVVNAEDAGACFRVRLPRG